MQEEGEGEAGREEKTENTQAGRRLGFSVLLRNIWPQHPGCH